MKLSPWQVMTTLLNNKTPTKEEKKKINSFFLVRWLSNDINTLPVSNYVNRFYDIPVEIQYQFCDDYLTLAGIKGKVKFIYYQKDKVDKDFQAYIESIQKKYNINSQQAQEYYNKMTPSQRNTIKETYENRI
jgi:hypothetical protein